jgi:hypothetical protein
VRACLIAHKKALIGEMDQDRKFPYGKMIAAGLFAARPKAHSGLNHCQKVQNFFFDAIVNTVEYFWNDLLQL